MRVIHLEIVADLSAEEFLLALRHFIVRRGKPQQIILDNAPQYKLAKSLADVSWENTIEDPDTQSHIAEQRIKCWFIVQLNSTTKSNRKNMPHNVTTPNPNLKYIWEKTASIFERRSK